MSTNRIILTKLSLFVLCLAAPALVLAQQKPEPTPTPAPDEDVLRISTELVQTDVVVLDKQGRFVDGLKPEQFSLKVDGQIQPIAFFDRITAGAANEERQLNVGRTAGANEEKPLNTDRPDAGAAGPTIRGRTILFFIDDMHLAADSMDRVRKVLLRFIDREMAPDDIVAISSPTGTIGFLQQFTNNKAVLRAAVSRLQFQPFIVSDRQRPSMNEFQALAIDRGETQVLEPFIEQMMRENPRMLRSVAEAATRQRASQILNQASVFTINMLGSLESMMRSSTRLPGRKLAFFFSDGFYIDRRNTGAQARMNMVTNIAARAGVVIYTLDARGLMTLVDPTQEEIFDPYGRHASVIATAAPISAAQDVLVTLAENTGGRVFMNSNKLETGVNAALAEISNYYLLAWRPNAEGNRGGKFHRLEVSVIGRPELKVRARQGYLTEVIIAKEKEAAKPPTVPLTPHDELRSAINSLTARKGLKASLAINYVDLPEKTVLLTIAAKIHGEDLSYTPAGDKFSSTVDVLGAVYDAKGQPVSSFQDKLNVTADSQQPESLRKVKAGFTTQAAVTPGLYQVRVAARDAQSKMVGSATEWIEVPDLTKGQLNMSGLYVTEMTQGSTPVSDAEAFKLSNLNIDRRFGKSSRLLFLTYLYNSSRGAAGTGAPDVAVQIEVMSDTKTVIKTDWRKVTADEGADLTRIPYSAEIPMRVLAPGRYTLRVTTNDRVARTTAVQSVRFVVVE